MTIPEMVAILVDKGYSREYAEIIAPLDIDEVNHGAMFGHTEECSMCRGSFTVAQLRYHYHPCE